MVVRQERQLQQFVLHNISWETYEKILDEIGETHNRVTYDNGDLEFMTLSLEHENYGEWLGRLIFFIALELKLPLFSGGSVTLKKSLRKVGIEPDRSYWIKHEKEMRGKKRWRAALDPPPDLAVEIDITSGWMDRLEIYAVLEVPEVWRYDGETLKVLILGPNGKYKEKSRSLAFPSLSLAKFAGFVAKLGSTDEVSLIRDFTEWLRTNVAPKKNGATGRRNGHR